MVIAGTAVANAALNLPVTGKFSGNGDFSGTISINRFEVRGNDIVAIGFVSGVLTRANHSVGTAVSGEHSWDVTLKSGPATALRTNESMTPLQQQTCPVLNLSLGGQNVNLLGTQVDLSGVTFDLAGEQGTPLGDLVCQINGLIGNVAGVVGVLNNLLGLLTGLLGGVAPAM